MNVSMHQRRLAEAELYAAEGIELIRHQRAAILELQRNGADATLAKARLQRMQRMYATIEESRATLLASAAA